GINLNFGYLWKNYRIDAHPPEKKPNEFSIKIRGCNYNKPYPPKKIGDIIPPQEPDSGLQQINRKEDAMSNQSADHKPKTNQANSLASLVLNFQNQIAQAHSLYQKTMADTHTEFLRVAERNLAALSGAPIDSIVHQTNTPPLSTTTVQSMPIYSAPIAQQPVVETQAVVSATMQAAPTMQAAVNNPQTVASSIMPQPQAAPEMQQPVFSPQPIAEPQATAEVAPTLEPVSNSITETAAADLHTVMLDVVAEKTGYPSHMINMDMDMESDLGIDSIKRVEILSGVQSKVPNLPKLDPNRMTALKTLNEIVEYFNEALDAEDNHSKKNP
ncbi:MAG: hypothetical protein K0U12_05615, partial [Gammaproteobacteria bacterium]|nr:hypothetical protein [Gammaproteobacteria bacterium]